MVPPTASVCSTSSMSSSSTTPMEVGTLPARRVTAPEPDRLSGSSGSSSSSSKLMDMDSSWMRPKRGATEAGPGGPLLPTGDDSSDDTSNDSSPKPAAPPRRCRGGKALGALERGAGLPVGELPAKLLELFSLLTLLLEGREGPPSLKVLPAFCPPRTQSLVLNSQDSPVATCSTVILSTYHDEVKPSPLCQTCTEVRSPRS
mmetsp:Transcript_38875/g.86473  ORF Transcript_38875/g.86473 Transcript_38875/m.86473 type:complete len:202 (+) Transcript_38875:609-1214(+)